jgi:hypothetical protein
VKGLRFRLRWKRAEGDSYRMFRSAEISGRSR